MTVLCFTHIPKTAGSSFSKTMASFFDPEQMLIAIKGLKSLTEYREAGHSPGDLKYIGGHAKLHDIDRHFDFSEDDLRPVTMVREPLQRAISHLLYLRRMPHALPDAGHLLADASLSDFIKISKDRAGLDLCNFQCWFLSGERSFAAARNVIERRYFAVASTDRCTDFCIAVARLLGVAEDPRFLVRTVNEAPVGDSLEDFRAGRRPANPLDLVNAVETAEFQALNAEDYRLFEYVANMHQGLMLSERYRDALPDTVRQKGKES